jgi:tetratricopeptide (TPR) repeat protein
MMMMWIRALLLAVVVVLFTVGTNGSGGTVLDQAEMLLERGQFAKSRDLYRSVLSQNPQDFQALQGAAVSSINMGDVRYAVHYFEQALALQSEPELHYNVGRIFLQIGDFSKALPHFESCSAQPSAVQRECHLKLAQLFRDMGNQQKVQLHLQYAIQLDPKRPDAYIYLADTYNNLKQFKLAIETYDKAILIAPKNAVIWNSKGDTHINLKQGLQSIECYKKGMAFSRKGSREYYDAFVGYFFSSLQLSDWKNWEANNLLLHGELTQYLLHNDGSQPPLLSAYRLLFLDAEPEVSVGISTVWSNKFASQTNLLQSTGSISSSRAASNEAGKGEVKLAIAYMSRRFEDYPGTQMMIQLFSRHNRSRVGVGALAGGIDDHSVYRMEIEDESDIFEDFNNLSIDQTLDMLKAHRFDVIIDYGMMQIVHVLSYPEDDHACVSCRRSSRFQFSKDFGS